MKTQTAKKLDSAVWLVAALLLILLIITWALLAAMLGTHTAARDTIALTPDQSRSALYQTVYRLLPAAPDVQTQDDEVQWESSTDVDLFKASYTNDQGTVTVQSENGEKIIAPGTTNVYTFSIRNTGNTALTYTLAMDSAFVLSDTTIPMQFRLRRGGDWLVGSDTQWCGLQEINAYNGGATLNPEKIDEYQLEWQWPYESDDVADTRLGTVSVTATAADTMAVDADFTLTITTTAEAAVDAPAINADGELLAQPRFTAREAALLALDLGVLALLLLLLFWLRGVYVCGTAPLALGAELACGRKKCSLSPVGGFVFGRIATGKRRFTLGGVQMQWRLQRKRDVQGLRFGDDNTVQIGRGIRAVELHLIEDAAGLHFDADHWAAVDSRNYVYTPAGVQPPRDDGSNATPGGLTADKRKRYTYRADEKANR